MTPPDSTPPEPSPKSALLHHPAVIAALVAALLGGTFGLLEVVIQPDFWREWRGQAATVEPYADLDSGSVATRLGRIRSALQSRKDGNPDIDRRRDAVTALVAISGEQPPQFYHSKAIEMLTEYVKTNIDGRRGPGVQVVVDPRPPKMFRPLDIIDAIEAIQVIRRAGGGRDRADLGGISFRQIKLSGLDLEEFYFGHADFSDSALSDCRCRGADFRHARFDNVAVWGTRGAAADFRDANFLAADLAGSKWANVDFSGSNIEAAKNHRRVAAFKDIQGLTAQQRALFP